MASELCAQQYTLFLSQVPGKSQVYGCGTVCSAIYTPCQSSNWQVSSFMASELCAQQYTLLLSQVTGKSQVLWLRN